jgi:hypothetical protein
MCPCTVYDVAFRQGFCSFYSYIYTQDANSTSSMSTLIDISQTEANQTLALDKLTSVLLPLTVSLYLVYTSSSKYTGVVF